MDYAVAPPTNMTNVFGKLITPTQLVDEEMVIIFYGENDNKGDEDSSSS
jgi:hypothetical protein